MANLTLDLVKKLYYQDKLSSIEISRKLGVSTDLVLSFMRREKLPRRNFTEANRFSFERKPKSFSLKGNLSDEEKKLKIAGVMLYWAEGAKFNSSYGSTSIDFANSNPKMIKLFLKFLRRICGVNEERLRVSLYCYANQDIKNLNKYWYELTKIPSNQFIKPYIREDFLPEKSGKMKYGLVHIRYADKKLVNQLKDWMEEYLDKNNI